MKITRVYSDEAGESHFDEFEIPLENKGDIGSLSETLKATGVVFRVTPGDYDFAWHNAPRKQYVVMLEGEVDVTVSTGETRRIGTGEILFVEDTEGKGHYSKAVDGKPRKSLFVTVD